MESNPLLMIHYSKRKSKNQIINTETNHLALVNMNAYSFKEIIEWIEPELSTKKRASNKLQFTGTRDKNKCKMFVHVKFIIIVNKRKKEKLFE